MEKLLTEDERAKDAELRLLYPLIFVGIDLAEGRPRDAADREALLQHMERVCRASLRKELAAEEQKAEDAIERLSRPTVEGTLGAHFDLIILDDIDDD